MRPRSPGQPPVETGVVDEDHGVGPLLLKHAVGHAEKAQEARQVSEDAEDADEGEITEGIQQATAGRRHAFAAKAVDRQVGLTPPQGVDEVGPVQIAAGFARADEQTHRSILPSGRIYRGHPGRAGASYQGNDDRSKPERALHGPPAKSRRRATQRAICLPTDEVNALSCPPEIAEIILEILQHGLLRIRGRGWRGDSAACASEADHLHNLPNLLSHYSPDLLRFYWEVERPAYCSSGGSDPDSFGPVWERLHSLLKQNGIG